MSQRNEFRDIVRGIGLLLAVHILAIAVGFILGYVLALISSTSPTALSRFAGMMATGLVFGLFGIGISQWLYVTPLLIWLRRRQKMGLFKGVLIGALLTMLLNGGCFLWFFHP